MTTHTVSTDPGYLQKYRRAEEHFNSLRPVLDQFVHDHPCPVEKKFDPNSKKLRWIVGDVPDASGVWSPVVGEFFFNCRSALDQIIYALVKRHAPKAPPRQLTYPIYKDPLEFAFHMREPLLNQLGNIDKHRRPHLAIFATAGFASFSDWPGGFMPYVGRVKKGTVLQELVVRKPEDMNMDFVTTFGVAFADGPAEWTAEILMLTVLSVLRRILESLGPFVGGPGRIQVGVGH